ncbi:hypothetical protein LX36DRAFT_488013 [Colletotrichum falcatum]|nr:hypothetical protein LX36DRAFT_488013 [Colletotrichum falcatum]
MSFIHWETPWRIICCTNICGKMTQLAQTEAHVGPMQIRRKIIQSPSNRAPYLYLSKDCASFPALWMELRDWRRLNQGSCAVPYVYIVSFLCGSWVSRSPNLSGRARLGQCRPGK